jgi:hypothetical protein
MKKIFISICILILMQTMQAQYSSEKVLSKGLIGNWIGSIKNDETENTLELTILKATFKTSGKWPISGYCTVNGKNKTYFSGTTQLIDGYVDLILKEKGNKATDGIFMISIAVEGLEPGSESKKLEGIWKQSKTKKTKEVLLEKME